MKNRIRIELVYLKRFLKVIGSKIPTDLIDILLQNNDMTALINAAFESEKVTRHDVKAVETALRNEFIEHNQPHLLPYIHFGLTSQDVNSTAVWIQLQSAVPIIQSALHHVIGKLKQSFFEPYKDLPMLSRTHGQPGTPTTFGKEMMVFVERLENAMEALDSVKWATKFGGATGGFNAHYVAYPDVDWLAFGDSFLKEEFGLHRLQFTTQIDHYDEMGRLFDAIKRINVVLIDTCRDMWGYISLGYLKQKPVSSEAVGSR